MNNTLTAWGCYHSTLLLNAAVQVMSSAWFPDACNWGSSDSSDQKSLFLTVWESFRRFLQIPSGFSCVYTEAWIESCHPAMKPRLVECCRDICPSVRFSHLHTVYGAQLELPSASWPTLWTLLHRLFGQEASSRQRPGCSKLIPLRIMETTCICQPLMQQIFFWTLSQISFLTEFCLCTLQVVHSFELRSWLYIYIYAFSAVGAVDLLMRGVCLSKPYLFNWICHRLTPFEM